MNIKSVLLLKYSLPVVIILTVVSPLLFLRLNEPDFSLNLYKFLAKAGSLCGTVLLIWQCLLGYRLFGGRMVRDFISLLNWHKTIGQYAFFLIVLHPIFITAYYLEKKHINPFSFSNGFVFDSCVAVGIAILLILLAIVVTSVFAREKMNFKSWYGVHITAYAVVLLIFLHSYPIGQTIGETALGGVWVLLFCLVTVLFLIRLLHQMGIGPVHCTVSKIKNVGEEAVEICFCPVGKRIRAQIGQFVYFRRNRRESGRPFTVSRDANGEFSITVKAQGRYSTGLQSIRPGQPLFVDGPYGVFMQQALESRRPLVMIAGGIGIAPFYRLLTEPDQQDRSMLLFYGSKTTDEIIYGPQLEAMEHVRVVHVISDQEDYEGEKGFITVELLQKYVQSDLKDHEFLLCGPPVMIKKIEQALMDAHIPADRIHHELFNF